MPDKGTHLLTYYPQGDVYPHRDERVDLMVDEEGNLADRTTKRIFDEKELIQMDYLIRKGNAVLYEKDADGYNVPATRERLAKLFPKPEKRHGSR